MKVTPSLAGLVLEVIALALIFAAIIAGKESAEIALIAVAAVALYFIAFLHFRIWKKQAS